MTWTSAVACRHRGALGHAQTVATWAAHPDCEGAAQLDGWQVGIDAATADERTAVIEALAPIRKAGLPLSSALVRLVTRNDVPPCSVLLADGEQLAALAWGRGLALLELGNWEYAVGSPADDDQAWSPLSVGTVVDLDQCGPTRFTLPCPHANT
ncbi:hypothetical protein [Nocardioides sp. Soil796]|uniref:hypothetical protein n=1 Tax=Nocardioides sp. Soil796 TaxID=1736412 RepID=UPI000710CA51|nr:hypothetical protein [Nocardioides sp. Soil796]KRF11023.1 hypothetical protein ASH02_19495 [Nocardioides sp. Soil796]